MRSLRRGWAAAFVRADMALVEAIADRERIARKDVIEALTALEEDRQQLKLELAELLNARKPMRL